MLYKPATRALLLVMFSLTAMIAAAQETPHSREPLRSPKPQPAISSVLAAFDKYEVVSINAGHDDKDIDDFVLALIRDPSFPTRVNDIVIECGNSLYQALLDRYVAGEQVSYTDVQKIWRNTTQLMCGQSSFYEQLIPTVRALNQTLPAQQRLRVVAADPPIDWASVRSQQEFTAFTDRDMTIATIMDRDVLSKHRKALMLFGIFHLLHESGLDNPDSVARYEKKYPHSTFVISDLGYFGTGPQGAADLLMTHWENPSLLNIHGTSLGVLKLSAFLPAPVSTSNDGLCTVTDPFSAKPDLVVSDLLDAFLYLGPQSLRLKESVPADVALDLAYTAELIRRDAIIGLPGPTSVAAFNQQTIDRASQQLFTEERLPDAKEFYPMIRQLCLDRAKTPKKVPE